MSNPTRASYIYIYIIYVHTYIHITYITFSSIRILISGSLTKSSDLSIDSSSNQPCRKKVCVCVCVCVRVCVFSEISYIAQAYSKLQAKWQGFENFYLILKQLSELRIQHLLVRSVCACACVCVCVCVCACGRICGRVCQHQEQGRQHLHVRGFALSLSLHRYTTWVLSRIVQAMTSIETRRVIYIRTYMHTRAVALHISVRVKG
jgi:hypothetical protein